MTHPAPTDPTPPTLEQVQSVRDVLLLVARIAEVTQAYKDADELPVSVVEALEADADALCEFNPTLLRSHADALARAQEREAGLRGALEWYGEQARLCRKITSEGDAGRQALDADGGKRARAALAPADAQEGVG